LWLFPFGFFDFAIDFMRGDIYYMIVKIHLDDGFGTSFYKILLEEICLFEVNEVLWP
jgi:hypothetical protein